MSAAAGLVLLLALLLVLAFVLLRVRAHGAQAPDPETTVPERRSPLPAAAAQKPTPRPAAPQPAGPRALLVGLSGALAGLELELDARGVAIGSDPGLSQLVYPADEERVSKRHCTLAWDAAQEHVLIEDCWSTSGTFVADGQPLAPGKARALQAGERFYLGDPGVMFELRFE